jgi:hypothetical protein
MNLFNITIFLLLVLLYSCQEKKKAVFAPSMEAYFTQKIKNADSSLTVESFQFIRLDTLHEKWTIHRQRFPFVRDYNIDSTKLDSLQKKTKGIIPTEEDLKMIQQLQDEIKYLGKELDSLSELSKHADTIKPVGYIAHYVFRIRRKDGSILQDSIGYSFDTKLAMLNWDNNNERNIDSIVSWKNPVLK